MILRPGERACFEKGFFLEEESTDPFLEQQSLIYHPTLNPTLIEVFVATHQFSLRALGRRRRRSLPRVEAEAWVSSPEDLLVTKALLASSPLRRTSKAAVDWSDIENILRAQRGALDLDLVRTEAAALGVTDRLEPLLWASA